MYHKRREPLAVLRGALFYGSFQMDFIFGCWGIVASSNLAAFVCYPGCPTNQ